MASTFGDWAQLARAYQFKAKPAAQVTPSIHALAQEITTGIDDRQAQARPSRWNSFSMNWAICMANRNSS